MQFFAVKASYRMIVIVAGNDKSIVIVGVGAPSTNDIVKPTPSARMCIEIMTSGHDCHPIPTSSTSQHYY